LETQGTLGAHARPRSAHTSLDDAPSEVDHGDRGAPRHADGPAPLGRRWPRRVGVNLAVIAVFSLPALLLWWNAWSGGAASTVRCSCLDPGQQVWFIAWPAYAVAHGLNPFFSNWLWPPHGVNLLNNASAPLVGLTLAPVTWAFGPLVSTTLALTLAPGLSAWGCWVACRRLTTWVPAWWIGGFLFGYSAFVVGNVGQGHVSVALLVVPPLVVVVLHEILVTQRRSPRWCGIALGLLLLAQFLISSEIFTMMVLVGLVGVVAAMTLSPQLVSERFPYAWRALVMGAVISVVLLAVPVWYTQNGPEHIVGSIWNGLQFIFIARGYQLWSAGPYDTVLWPGAPQGPPVAFVGLGILAVAAASVALAWRRRTVWVVAIVAVVGAILSWGSVWSLKADQTVVTHLLPWSWFIARPIFDNISAVQFSAFTDLALALVIAIGLDALHRSSAWGRMAPAARVALLAGLVVLMVLPPWLTYQAPLAVQQVNLPPWFTTSALNVPRGSVVVTYPFPASADATSQPMVWQAVDGMHFRLAGGYVKFPGPHHGVIGLGPLNSATRTLDGLTYGTVTLSGTSALTPRRVEGLTAALRRWGASYIVVTNTGHSPVLAAGAFTAVTGMLPQVTRRAWVWDLRQRARPPSPDATTASGAFSSCRTTTTSVTPVPPDRPLPQSLNRCVMAGLTASTGTSA
jgi:hypothetical protein